MTKKHVSWNLLSWSLTWRFKYSWLSCSQVDITFICSVMSPSATQTKQLCRMSDDIERTRNEVAFKLYRLSWHLPGGIRGNHEACQWHCIARRGNSLTFRAACGCLKLATNFRFVNIKTQKLMSYCILKQNVFNYIRKKGVYGLRICELLLVSFRWRMIHRRENDFKTSVSLPEIVQREVGTNSFEEVTLQAKTLDGHAFTFNESNDLTDTPPLMTIIRVSDSLSTS